MHEYLLWISLFAYAFHTYEEVMLNWKKWAETALGLKNLTWADFYVANSAVVVAGVCAAMVGWKLPCFALLLPALQLINGLGFHIFPTLIQKRFSPGVLSATVLFLPIALWNYYGAYQDGVLTIRTTLLSFLFGGILMATPFVFLKLKKVLRIPANSA